LIIVGSIFIDSHKTDNIYSLSDCQQALNNTKLLCQNSSCVNRNCSELFQYIDAGFSSDEICGVVSNLWCRHRCIDVIGYYIYVHGHIDYDDDALDKNSRVEMEYVAGIVLVVVGIVMFIIWCFICVSCWSAL